MPHRYQSIADQWAGELCTLDGRTATVQGRLLPFAIIRTIDGSASVEYAWPTVDYLMRGRAEFRSR